MAFQDDLSKEISRRKSRKAAVSKVVDEYYKKREELDEDEEALRDKLRSIKKQCVEDLDDLIEKTKDSFRKKGVSVYIAKDADEALEIIEKTIGNEKNIVKSKSNTCKEIGLEKLEKKGKEIIETDTGDFVVKLVGEKGIHQVIPAMHITPKEISAAINKKFKKNIGNDPVKITHFIADHLREKIKGAGVGITGANSIAATGTIVLLENEGNISLVSRVPKKHIVVAGIEKIVPTLEEAMHIVKCATIWGSGRGWPVYVSLISGPSSTADIENELVCGAQGACEVTLVLIDNGRTELRDRYPEMLYCINCGACNNLCPAYRQVLGFFGERYPGPKGIVYAALLGKGEANYLCNLCENCKYSCPAKIDLPEYIRRARGELHMETDKNMIKKIREHGTPFGKLEKGKTPDKLYCC